jgi:multidrug efflux pump subunit AcrA (membrane-fusion protein)
MRARRTILVPLLTLAASAVAEEAIDPGRAANTIILDEIGVKNLRIETVPVEPQVFEKTVFAIGRIEETPSSRSALSSRISGRAVKVNAFIGDFVEQGTTLVEVESRQPGNPPPVIPLKAAQSGLVIESHIKVGQPIEPDEELLDISDRSVMWAIAKIPEKEAAGVKVGTHARIRIPALGGEPIEAKLDRFGIAADREAGTVEGIFELQNANDELQPGMRAEFSIITAKRENVMAVPRAALQGDPSKRVVFVKDFDLPNAFVRAPVQVGEQNDGFIEIAGGLFPGDEVVTQGSYSLGFAGGGSISLKEALDAAHGHEHNEDGSEMTPEQKAAKEAAKAGPGTEGGKMSIPLLIYAGVATLAWIVFAQLYFSKRRSAA